MRVIGPSSARQAAHGECKRPDVQWDHPHIDIELWPHFSFFVSCAGAGGAATSAAGDALSASVIWLRMMSAIVWPHYGRLIWPCHLLL